MFSKKQRLSREEILGILEKNTEKHNSPSFFIRVSNIKNGEEPKFSIIVSKKVEKLAVKRHLSKRIVIGIIKEIIRDNQVNNKGYIINLKKSIEAIDREVLKEELVKILN